MNIMRRRKISEVTKPRPGLFQIYVDSWWAVSNDDEVYFFGTQSSPYNSPQCNQNGDLAKRINDDRAIITDAKFKHCELTNYRETMQLPIVYVPVNISDYV